MTFMVPVSRLNTFYKYIEKGGSVQDWLRGECAGNEVDWEMAELRDYCQKRLDFYWSRKLGRTNIGEAA